MSLPHETALIFDLDGTLVDSLADIHAALNAAFLRKSAVFSLEEVRRFVGLGAPTLISRAMAHVGLTGTGQHRDLLAAFLAIYARQPSEKSRVYPGVFPALGQLTQLGFLLAICTNKPQAPADALLKDMGLTRFFPTVFGGDRFKLRKPDPLPALACLKATGAKRAVFIGDSEVDAETAARAGMPFVLFTEGYRKTPVDLIPAMAIFSDYAALPGLITGLVPTGDHDQGCPPHPNRA